MRPIKILLPLLFCLAAATAGAAPFKCTVCHSKNPAMVQMHKALQDRETGCFDCHKPGEKLMGKSRPKDRQSLLSRRQSEAVCTPCHLK